MWFRHASFCREIRYSIDRQHARRNRGSHGVDLLHPSGERQRLKVKADLVGEGVGERRRKTALGEKVAADRPHARAKSRIERLFEIERTGKTVKGPTVEPDENGGENGEIREDLTVSGVHILSVRIPG